MLLRTAATELNGAMRSTSHPCPREAMPWWGMEGRVHDVARRRVARWGMQEVPSTLVATTRDASNLVWVESDDNLLRPLLPYPTARSKQV